MDAITYFVQMGNYVIKIALDLGRLLAFVGFIWTCLQVVMGQKKMADMLVGTAMKWIMFFLVFSMYPGFCAGLRKLSTTIGNQASGTSISFINREITDFFTTIEQMIAANNIDDAMAKAQMDVEEEFRKRRAEVDYVYDNQETGVRVKDDELMALAQAENKSIASASKKAKKKAGKALKKAQKEFEKKITAFKDVLVIDETNQLEKYKVDLSLKTASGKDTGFISPTSVFKITVFLSEIMFENIQTEYAEDGTVQKKNSFNLLKLTVKDIQSYILCGVTALGMILTSLFVLIQYVMAIIEYAVISSFAVLLVPCMLFDGLKDLSNKILPSLMAQAIKLMMIIICLYWCILSFIQIGKNIVTNDAAFDLKLFAFVAFNLVLILAICSNAPKLASTLLTGQPHMSMGEFVGAAGSMLGAAAGAAKLGGGAVKGAAGAVSGAAKNGANSIGNIAQSAGAAKQGAKESFEKAKEQGKGGVKSALHGAAGAVGGAIKETGRQVGSGIKERARNLASGQKGLSSTFQAQAKKAKKAKTNLSYGDYVKQRFAQGAQHESKKPAPKPAPVKK